MQTANEIIRKHYRVPRPVTDKEVIDELVNLRRKYKKQRLDSVDEALVRELQENNMISIPKV
jgi:hypothetical protein